MNLVKPKTTEEADALLKEIRAEGGEPLERLKSKCQWEHMTMLAVLKNWGDPRRWP